MKIAFLPRLLCLFALVLASTAALATVYDFSSTFPACSSSSGNWVTSGTTYTCSSGSMSLAAGDSIVVASSITVVAESGITLAGNNTIGSSSQKVNLQTAWGDLVASNSGNKTTTFYGNLTSSSGDINLTNALVYGYIDTQDHVVLSGGSVTGNVSGRNGVTTTKSTTIGGNVTANAGQISLSGGSVTGSVHSDCCTITTYYTDIGGNLSTTVLSSNSNTVSITGGTISGQISTSGGSGISIDKATVTSGSISATGVKIEISDSTIGSSSNQVNVTGNNYVTITGSTIWGNVTAGDWASALSIDSSSVIYGICTSNNNSVTTPTQYPRCATAGSAVDHVALEVIGTPLTCTPARVTVKVCANAACTTLTTAAVSVTLTASNGGAWATSPLTVIGSATTTLRKTTIGTTTLAASSGASGATTCAVNGVLQNNCKVAFADSGLLLSVPTQTAGVLSSGTAALSVSAVRKSNNNLDCAPAFANVTRSVKFWSEHTNPVNVTKALAVGGTSVVDAVTTLAASTSSTGTAISLTFDASGKASATLKYDDAGQLALRARYDGSAANGDANLVMSGEQTFVTVPYGLCVDSPDQNADGTAAWLCAAADLTTCSKYRKAGEEFKLRVTGKASSTPSPTATPTPAQLCAMPTTANYQQNDIALSSKVVAPAGGVDGALGTTRVNIVSDGTATISDQTLSEVGVFTFTATPPANAYFGTDTVAPGTSANFGRFVPHHFNASAVTVVPRSDLASCSSSVFSYLDEPLRISGLILTAVTLAGNTTKNYVGDFSRLDLSSSASKVAALKVGAQHTTATLPATFTNFYSSDVTTNRLNFAYSGTSYTDTYPASDPDCPGAPTLAWCKGKSQITLDITLKRAAAPDGPFLGVVLGISPLDSDDVAMGALDFQRAYSGSGSLAGDGQKIAKLTNNEIRFGRLKLSNFFGSEKVDLKMPVQAQYWSGKSWVLNSDDSCTKLLDSAFALYPSGVSTSASAVALSSGKGVLTLTKPSPVATGYVDVAANLGASGSGNDLSCLANTPKQSSTPAGLPWLRSRNGSCASTYDRDPSARASFGIYSPELKRTVHVRELY